MFKGFYRLLILKPKAASTADSSNTSTPNSSAYESERISAVNKPTKNKAAAKSRKKVIVISNFYNAVVGNTEPQVGRQLVALFESAFTKNGAYQVAASSQIKEILKNQDISFDERMDPKTAAKIGKVASANVFVFGNITEFNLTKGGFNIGPFGGKVSYTVKLGLTVTLVDVNTGLALKSVKVEETVKDSSIKKSRRSRKKFGDVAGLKK